MFNTILGALQGNSDPKLEAIKEVISNSLNARKAAVQVCDKLDTAWGIKDLKVMSLVLIEGCSDFPSQPFENVLPEHVVIILTEFLFQLYEE